MRIEVTEQAVFVTDLDDEDRRYLEILLARSAGKSLIIPRRPTFGESTDREVLEALIGSMRTSAQDTLAALRRRGYRIVRAAAEDG
jgi:hypothetical protein